MEVLPRLCESRLIWKTPVVFAMATKAQLEAALAEEKERARTEAGEEESAQTLRERKDLPRSAVVHDSHWYIIWSVHFSPSVVILSLVRLTYPGHPVVSSSVLLLPAVVVLLSGGPSLTGHQTVLIHCSS